MGPSHEVAELQIKMFKKATKQRKGCVVAGYDCRTAYVSSRGMLGNVLRRIQDAGGLHSAIVEAARSS